MNPRKLLRHSPLEATTDPVSRRVRARSQGARIYFLLGGSAFLLSLAICVWPPRLFPFDKIFQVIPSHYLPFFVASLVLTSYWISVKRKLGRLRQEILRKEKSLEKTLALLEEVNSFYQSSSVISAHRDEGLLLDLIVRESLKCLRAHRCILFFQESGNDIPSVARISATEPQHEQVNQEEEKECARRTLSQNKPILLREAREFADIFPSGERNRSIHSLLSVPLIYLGKPFGVLNVSLLDGSRKFNEEDLEYLVLFSQHAAAAIKNMKKNEAASRLADFEQDLEKIAISLRQLPEDDLKEALDRFRILLMGGIPKQKEVPKGHPASFATEGLSNSGQTDQDPAFERSNREMVLQAQIGDHTFDFSEDFGEEGLFIRTSNPFELGEKFLLRLQDAHGADPVEVPCKVIWTNKYGMENKHLSRGMGVKFLNLRPQDREKVREYIKSTQTAKESAPKVEPIG